MLLTKFRFIWPSVFKEDLFKSTNQKQEVWWPCLLADREEMCTLYKGPSIATSYKVSVHLAKRFQRKQFFRN
jgi:hypothetical protein